MPNEPSDHTAVQTLYHTFLAAWNNRDAAAYAALVAPDGNLIGFDGSIMNGRAEIQAAIQKIFADHRTARYVPLIREIRPLSENVILLRAAAGMVRPNETEIFTPNNAIQSLVATREAGQWLIALFQNAPAAFHGRPEQAAALSDELTTRLSQLL